MRAVVIAAAVAFLVSLLGTPVAIKAFTRLKLGQPIRIHTPQTHLVKRGTPTMGGVVFILATLIAYVAGHLTLSSLPAAQIAQVGPTMTALVLLGVFVFSGAIGFIDDFLKIRERNSLGLSERVCRSSQIRGSSGRWSHRRTPMAVNNSRARCASSAGSFFP